MRQLKTLLCLGLAVVMLLAGSSNVYAVTHVEGCGATGKTVTCGAFANRISNGAHVLYITSNETYVTCSKEAEIHYHTIRCANKNCNVVLQSNATRTCTVIHSICPNETGVCQY